MSTKLRSMLDNLRIWSDTQRTKAPYVPADSLTPAVDWEAIINARIADLKSSIDIQSNNEVSCTHHCMVF